MNHFPKATTTTDFFNEEENVIVMNGWLEPTLRNIGAANVDILGNIVEPGDTFRIGSSGVLTVGNYDLKFIQPTAQEVVAKVSVTYQTIVCDN